MISVFCPNPSVDIYAWIDKFENGCSNRIERIQEFPGGKGIHVALAVAELTGYSKLFGIWAGNNGLAIQQACKEKNVEISGIKVTGNNRHAYTFLSPDPSLDQTELIQPGPSFPEDQWENLVREFRKLLPDSTIICFSGSWPLHSPVGGYAQLIKLANDRGIKTFLDCSGDVLKNTLHRTNIFGLHVNEHEAKEFCGSSDISVLLKLLHGKVELVALSKGKEGLVMAYQGEIIAANVRLEKVLNSVGSGDCLVAGIAIALSKGLDPRQIIAYGVAAGASNCLTSDLGMLKKEDFNALLKQIEYHE